MHVGGIVVGTGVLVGVGVGGYFLMRYLFQEASGMPREIIRTATDGPRPGTDEVPVGGAASNEGVTPITNAGETLLGVSGAIATGFAGVMAVPRNAVRRRVGMPLYQTIPRAVARGRGRFQGATAGAGSSATGTPAFVGVTAQTQTGNTPQPVATQATGNPSGQSHTEVDPGATPELYPSGGRMDA